MNCARTLGVAASYQPCVDPTFVLLNRLEACLWIGMAVAISLSLSVRHRWTAFRLIGVVTLLVFGASDLVEATTGAWWRPWWLFAWKTTCVLSFAGWLWDERCRRRRIGATA